MGSMLNDLNIAPDGSAVMFAGAPAVVACATSAMRDGDHDACRRSLEG
eukprot:gene28232-3296_t